ncbi:MAG: radical SAM protein [Candidatus Omnitrophota bacterium]
MIKKIKDYLTLQAISKIIPVLPRLSNKQLISLTYMLKRLLKKPDAFTENVLSSFRNYFENNHPSVELIRRGFKQLNPLVRKRFTDAFLINGVFKSLNKNKEFEKKYGFIPPWLIVLSATMRCNLNCVGCSTRKYTKGDDLPIGVINRILKEAKEMGIYFIVTQGGEMFVYQEMLEVYKKHKDMFFQVYTNGTLIDRKMARRLAKIGNVAPMISLEGFEQETDQRRGKGVFKKVMQAMDNLKEAGVLFGASITQTSKNTDVIASTEFVDMLISKGCLVVWFFQFLPVGKDPDINLMASPKQRLELKRRIQKIRTTRPIFIGDFWNDGPHVGGCIAGGKHYFHINNHGDIEPCAFTHFAVDNIKNKTLIEALNSDFFKFMRKNQPFGNGNLLTPCMIIDNPEILRQAVKNYGARPTHEGAEVILQGEVKEALDKYSQELHKIFDPEWEKIKDTIIEWPR